MELSEKICALRLAKGMSQEELANELAVSRQSVSKWETGASVPELNKLIGMSRVFGVSLDELVMDAEHEKSAQAESRTRDIPEKRRLKAREIAGIILLSIGGLVFFLFSILGGLIMGLYALPFLLCGILCVLIKRHCLQWCLWCLYVLAYAYLRVFTGVRFWWVFAGWIYRDGLERAHSMGHVRRAFGSDAGDVACGAQGI